MSTYILCLHSFIFSTSCSHFDIFVDKTNLFCKFSIFKISCSILSSIFLINKHNRKRRYQQYTAYQNSLFAEQSDRYVTHNRTYRKYCNYAEKQKSFFHCGFVFCKPIITYRLRCHTQVTYAHCSRHTAALYLSETFNLCTARKRCKTVCKQIQFLRYKHYAE